MRVLPHSLVGEDQLSAMVVYKLSNIEMDLIPNLVGNAKEDAWDVRRRRTSDHQMPFFHGAVVSAGLKYRFIIAVLLVYILYSQWRHNNDLFLIIEKAGNDLSLCQNYAESLVAKLRVIYDHKMKMEKIFNSKRVSSQGKRKVFEHLWHLCEENLTSITLELDECRSGKRDQIPHPDLSGAVLLNRLQG
ncbi:unnamed protein product [Haemonchus placei]|uniref:MSC domain-containing protein n=1 Tax=Haemonchus placei TaxID=6290 RepID=A0A0N4WUA3_HAEPC|nr:unnamed protein product [Haemonchus placei]